EPSPAVVDLCLESVDVLKKTLHRQWADEAEMRTGVDSLLGRVAEFAPLEPEEGETLPAAAELAAQHAKPAEKAAASQITAKKLVKQIAAASAAKSVRIALSRLDRMMNTVGELVINRTRMVGRVGELEKLVDTLSFSKERLQGKVAEFQEKYEFNRISTSRNPVPWNSAPAPKLLSSAASGENSFWSEFSGLEMDRYDDVNILSRSMAEISADVNEVLSQLEAFIVRVEGYTAEFTKLAPHLQDECITAAITATSKSKMTAGASNTTASSKAPLSAASFRWKPLTGSPSATCAKCSSIPDSPLLRSKRSSRAAA